MTKTLCPGGCRKIFISKEHAEAHADAAHLDWKIPKARGWSTPFGFVDFRQPVTYEEARKVARQIQNSTRWKS